MRTSIPVALKGENCGYDISDVLVVSLVGKLVRDECLEVALTVPYGVEHASKAVERLATSLSRGQQV
ncbi:hypothetical protein [Nesterenkonia alkaliphila]|uniref:Uncharacterized protein n=1 Tax=Nesterenkonia alkaliphila TaxID=1463631 RepID=A0A7K1UK34_9MICC|nr:hypothetical protein [Nesterenkonia alkaliphila]MVT26843.1 hypothetical protein [Nesterenkonia alkaliphila]GFZ99573.1 hypothetical protein GCM10011359_30600 [Nesterenkonia alkaliphila]